MTAKLIDGKAIAASLRERIKSSVGHLRSNHDLIPGLAVVLVGEDPASEIYVRNKGIATKEAGMNSFEFKMPETTSEEDLLSKVRELNSDPAVHGILVQFPVPDQIEQQNVIETIAVEKDVDGLSPKSAGYLASGIPGLVPCTPTGCMILIHEVLGEKLDGKQALVIGRSNLVGKPVAQLLLKQNCTVTLAHSRTRDLAGEARRADILVAAVGVPLLVKGDWVKPGACVIDVGMNRIDAPEKGPGKSRLVGDVDFEEAKEVAGAITPVPGGVGPMTIACLLRNTVIAACRQHDIPAPDL